MEVPVSVPCELLDATAEDGGCGCTLAPWGEHPAARSTIRTVEVSFRVRMASSFKRR